MVSDSTLGPKNVGGSSDQLIRPLARTVIHTHSVLVLPGQSHYTRSSSLQPLSCPQTVLSGRLKKKKMWSRAEQHANIPEAESGSDYLDETLSDRNTSTVDKIKTHTHTQSSHHSQLPLGQTLR